MRPTVHDIAKVAGVSLATVDRVLNARPGVREGTISRVNAAIDTLGYVRDVAAANLARQRDFNFVFVLPDRDTAFIAALRDEIAAVQSHARTDRMTIRRVDVSPHDPQAMVAALHLLADEGVDGVAVMAPETPQTRDAVRHLRAAGAQVVTLVSDIQASDRNHFVGINNLAAGSTAGVLVGRFLGARPGKVLVIAGSMLNRDHAERRLGFDRVMQADFPHLDVLPTLEGRDDAAHIADVLPEALARGDISAIYSIGAGNRGLVRVLKETDAPRIVVVAHELTPTSRAALEDRIFDAVITQDTGHMIRSAARVLRAYAERREIIASQERIRIDIFLRENLP